MPLFQTAQGAIRQRLKFLYQRQATFSNVLSLTENAIFNIHIMEDANKTIFLRNKAREAGTLLKKIESAQKTFSRTSYLRNYIFAGRKKRQDYLAKKNICNQLITDYHNLLDTLKYTTIGYCDELLFTGDDHIFAYFSVLLPQGPLRDFYEGWFKLRSAEKSDDPDNPVNEQLEAQAKQSILKAISYDYGDIHHADTKFCHALHLDCLSACYQEQRNRNQDLDNAARIYTELSQYNYLPAMSRHADVMNDREIVRFLPGYSQKLRAAIGGYIPAVVDIGKIYKEFNMKENEILNNRNSLRSQNSELEIYPSPLFDPKHHQRIEKLLLDAYFLHDSRFAKEALDMHSDCAGKAIESLEKDNIPITAAGERFIRLHQLYEQANARRIDPLYIVPQKLELKPRPTQNQRQPEAVESEKTKPVSSRFNLLALLTRTFLPKRKSFKAIAQRGHKDNAMFARTRIV